MKSTLLTFCCLAAVGVMPAAEAATPPAVTLAGTAHHRLFSAQIGQTYDLFVSLPEDYLPGDRPGQAPAGQQAGTAPLKRYPVLYVLDGWHFPLLAFFRTTTSTRNGCRR